MSRKWLCAYYTTANSFSFYIFSQNKYISNSHGVLLDSLFSNLNDLTVRADIDMIFEDNLKHNNISFDLPNDEPTKCVEYEEY